MENNNVPNTVSITTKNTVSLTLGIIATVIGVLALLIGWVPFIGLIAVPGAVLGLILAGVGLVIALVKGGKGFGLPLLGGGLCAGALGLAAFTSGSAAAAIDAGMSAIKERDQANAGVQVEPGKRGTTPASDSPNPTTEAPVWTPADKALRVEDMLITVKGASVGQVALKNLFGDPRTSEDEFLKITIELSNVSDGKKVDYLTWQSGGFGSDFATLVDDKGNRYRKANFGSSTTVVGGAGHESIYPQKSITDVLVFERPVTTATWLHLELEAENFDGKGKVRFEIPTGMIK